MASTSSTPRPVLVRRTLPGDNVVGTALDNNDSETRSFVKVRSHSHGRRRVTVDAEASMARDSFETVSIPKWKTDVKESKKKAKERRASEEGKGKSGTNIWGNLNSYPITLNLCRM